MRLIIRFFLTCGLQSLVCLNNANAQEVFATADSLVKLQQYDNAALEYERVIFLSSDEGKKQEALFRKADCLKLSGDYKNELSTLSRLNTKYFTDTLRYNYYYERALACYLTDNFENAENELTQLNYFVKDSSMINESLFLQILVLNELHEWQQAKIFYQTFLSSHHLTYDSIPEYSFLDEKVFKSPTKARWFSAIVPGAGQVYAGKFWRGLSNNILFDGSTAYCVFSAIDKYYFSAAFTGATLMFRFYVGGIRYSARLAEDYNKKRSREINDKIKNVIITIEQ